MTVAFIFLRQLSGADKSDLLALSSLDINKPFPSPVVNLS